MPTFRQIGKTYTADDLQFPLPPVFVRSMPCAGFLAAVKRVVSCVLLQVDSLGRSTLPVLVVGCTSVPGSVDASLRRFGRFDRELDLGVPDDQGREEIFRIHTRNMRLADDVDPRDMAKKTHGYSSFCRWLFFFRFLLICLFSNKEL